MTPSAERRALQAAIAMGLLVSLYAGGTGVLEGPAMVKGSGGTDLDSHFRYLSGLLLAIGIGFATCLPGIERKTARFRLLALVVFTGGLGRLLGLISAGLPGQGHVLGLVMELGAVPLLVLWQARVAAQHISSR